MSLNKGEKTPLLLQICFACHEPNASWFSGVSSHPSESFRLRYSFLSALCKSQHADKSFAVVIPLASSRLQQCWHMC